jgi:hypothetical protein
MASIVANLPEGLIISGAFTLIRTVFLENTVLFVLPFLKTWALFVG